MSHNTLWAARSAIPLLILICGCTSTPVKKTAEQIRADEKPGLVTVEYLSNLLEAYPLCDESSSTCQEQKAAHESQMTDALTHYKDSTLRGGLIGKISDLHRQEDGKWSATLLLSDDVGERKMDAVRQGEILEKFSSIFQGKDPGEWKDDKLTGLCVTHLTPDLNAPAEVVIKVNDAVISAGASGESGLKDGGYALIVEGAISPPTAFMSTWVSGYYNKGPVGGGNATYGQLNLHASSAVLEPVDPGKVELVNRCRKKAA